MDILDLVALMRKYAEENTEILEFEERETFAGRKLIFYSLNVKREELKKYFFSLTHGYSGQIIGEIKYSKVDFLDIQGNSVIQAIENTSKELDEWIKLIQRAAKAYNSSENNNRKGDSNIPIITSAATPISFTFLNNLFVKDFFCIQEEIILENLENKKEIYFLGENGDGKTLILQAILIAFKWHFIEHDPEAPKYTGIVTSMVRSAGLKLEIIASDSANIYSYNANEISNTKIEERLSKIKYLQNIFAYGVNRRYNSKSENKEQYGFMNLFDDSQSLRNPVEWLKNIERLDLKQINKGITLKNTINILEDLLGENVKILIEEEVIFEERGFPVKFEALSEGYKSVMTWVADLVSRLAENQPEVKELQDYQGIVLVDEISLHLHPKWEYELVRKLRGWFPNIQFIMTTHSPVTVLGASEEAVFFKVYKENGITKVKPYEELQLGNMRADQILTSEFFGLASARPAYLQEYMNLRKEILTKTELTKEDEGKLKKLEDRYGTLPTGETKEELKTMAFLQKIAKKLNVDDTN